jgi:hypothetical protein
VADATCLVSLPLTNEKTVANIKRIADSSNAKLWPERYAAAKFGANVPEKFPMKSW